MRILQSRLLIGALLLISGVWLAGLGWVIVHQGYVTVPAIL